MYFLYLIGFMEHLQEGFLLVIIIQSELKKDGHHQHLSRKEIKETSQKMFKDQKISWMMK